MGSGGGREGAGDLVVEQSLPVGKSLLGQTVAKLCGIPGMAAWWD